MRMLLTMLLLVFASIASYAVEYDESTADAVNQTTPAEAKAYWESVVPATSQQSYDKFHQICIRTAQVEKLKTDAYIALVNAKASELGITNADNILFNKVDGLLNIVLDYTKALELALTGNGTEVKNQLGMCYGAIGDYKNAVKFGTPDCITIYVGKLADVTSQYNACIKVFDNKLSVAQVNRLKGTFFTLRTRGTDITNAQKLADYQDIQDAYSDMTTDSAGKRVYVYDAFLAELTAAITRLKARM